MDDYERAILSDIERVRVFLGVSRRTTALTDGQVGATWFLLSTGCGLGGALVGVGGVFAGACVAVGGMWLIGTMFRQ